MVREDQRELLDTHRAKAKLMVGWKATTLTRAVILFDLLLLCGALWVILGALYPTAWIWRLLCGMVSAVATVLIVYHSVTEYIDIQSASFEIAEDTVFEIMPSETRQKNAALFLGFRMVHSLRFILFRDPGVNYAEYYLSFSGHGKVGVGKSQYDRATVGESFYLILLGKNKKAVKCVLSAKTYRIK